MRKLLTIITIIFFSIQSQAQLSANQKKELRDSLNKVRGDYNSKISIENNSFNDFIARYTIDTAASNSSIRDLQTQMAALTKRVVSLEAWEAQQLILNTNTDAAIKQLQLDIGNLQKDDSIFFDTASFIVINNKYVYLKYPDLPQRVTELENWRTITQPMIDSLMAYMDKLKKTVFVNPFPQ